MDLTATPLGRTLKIYQKNGLKKNLYLQAELWKIIQMHRVAPSLGRELKYAIQTSLGPAAAGPVGEGGDAAFLSESPSKIQELIAYYKNYSFTVGVPLDVLNKGTSAMERYVDTFANEIDSKMTALAQRNSIYGYGDGSGAIGHVAAIAVSGGKLIVTLTQSDAQAGRSQIDWFLYDDHVKFAAADGTLHDTVNTTVGIEYFKVVDINQETAKVTLEGYNSAGALVTITTSDEPTAGDYLYFKNITPANLNSVSDFNSVTSALVGLETLTANDGRILNGAAMSGALAGSRVSGGGAPIDPGLFLRMLSKCKGRVGKGRYVFETALLHEDAWRYMLEAAESSRYFAVHDNPDRGGKSISFTHDKDVLRLVSDQFCPKQRVFAIPRQIAKEYGEEKGKSPIQFFGQDFVQVDVGGKSHLKNTSSGSGHARTKMEYFEGCGVITNEHPAAVGVITDFSIPS